MKIQQQHNSDLTLLSEMIEEITVAMLTNVNEHGALTSRPMTPLEMDSEGALWFFIDRTSVPKVERLSEANLSFSDEERFMCHSQAGASWTTTATSSGACGPLSLNHGFRKARSRWTCVY